MPIHPPSGSKLHAETHVRALQATTVATEDIKTWAAWALAQMDRIDPVLDGRLLDTMHVTTD